MDESRQEVHRPMSLCTPKDNLYIGSWNVRSMYITGKTAQIEQEMNRYHLDVLGLSEVRWPMNGKVTLQSGKEVLYSGRDDGLHQEGVGMILSKRAKKSLIEWEPINQRLMYARLFTTTLKISIVDHQPMIVQKRQKRHFLNSCKEL